MVDGNLGLIKIGTFVTSGSLMSSLIIFQDDTYFKIAILGAIASVFGLVHELLETDKEIDKKYIVAETMKALFLGAILTPMTFILLIATGTTFIPKDFLDTKMEVLHSMWFMISILGSWYSIPIWNKFVKVFKRKVKERMDGK